VVSGRGGGIELALELVLGHTERVVRAWFRRRGREGGREGGVSVRRRGGIELAFEQVLGDTERSTPRLG